MYWIFSREDRSTSPRCAKLCAYLTTSDVDATMGTTRRRTAYTYGLPMLGDGSYLYLREPSKHTLLADGHPFVPKQLTAGR